MLKRLLVTTALLAPLPAQASTITVFDVNSFGGEIIAQNEFIGYGPIFFNGQKSGGVVSAFHNGNTYELAANNVSNTMADTLNIYALWQGVTSPTGLITITTQMATDEFTAGWVLSELIYINGQALPLVGNTQFGLGGPPNQTFQVTANTPFDLQLQLQYVSNGANLGDFGSYVIATLADPPPVHVPGPVVGAGLPGLLALVGGWLWRRKRKHA